MRKTHEDEKMKTKKRKQKLGGIVRDRMIQDGAYDGRFRSKTFVDRKKESERRGCKQYRDYEYSL